MIASRWTSHRPVWIDCPACGVPLPPVMVNVDARADHGLRDTRRVVGLDVSVDPLTAAWWDRARAEHPGCIPDEDPPPAGGGS